MPTNRKSKTRHKAARRRDHHAKPDSTTLAVAPPRWLADGAAEEWPAIVAELARRGLAEQVNPTHVAVYCQLLSQYKRVTATLNRDGQVLEVRNDKGVLTRQDAAPEVAIQLGLVQKLRQLWSDFEKAAPVTGPDSNGEQQAGTLSGAQGNTDPVDPRQRLRARLASLGAGRDQ